MVPLAWNFNLKIHLQPITRLLEGSGVRSHVLLLMGDPSSLLMSPYQLESRMALE